MCKILKNNKSEMVENSRTFIVNNLRLTEATKNIKVQTVKINSLFFRRRNGIMIREN